MFHLCSAMPWVQESVNERVLNKMSESEGVDGHGVDRGTGRLARIMLGLNDQEAGFGEGRGVAAIGLADGIGQHAIGAMNQPRASSSAGCLPTPRPWVTRAGRR